MERTQILLDEKLKRKIKHIAELEKKSMACVVRDAVFQYTESKQTSTSAKDLLLNMFKKAKNPMADNFPEINSSNFRDHFDKLTNLP